MIVVSAVEKKRLIVKTKGLSNALKDRLIPFEKEPELKAKQAREAWLHYFDKFHNNIVPHKRGWEGVQPELDDVERDWRDYFEFLNDQLVRSSIVVMFHFFERELRSLLLQHLDKPDFERFYPKKNRGPTPIKIAEESGLLANHLAELRNALDRSRLLCHAIKHGPGDPLDKLKKELPAKVEEALEIEQKKAFILRFDEDVIVDATDFDVLVGALQEFWASLPEHS